jgi:hypothetical protein
LPGKTIADAPRYYLVADLATAATAPRLTPFPTIASMFILGIPGGGGNQPDAVLACDADARLSGAGLHCFKSSKYLSMNRIVDRGL